MVTGEQSGINSSVEECARLTVDVASNRLGSDVVLLDLRDIGAFADFFVIATGETSRHLESIASDIMRSLRDKGTRIHHREGHGNAGWILLDFGGLVVQLFDNQSRERFGLEKLWARATEIVRVQ